MERSYKSSIGCLNSRKARAGSNLDDMRGSDDMLKWLQIIGHSIEVLEPLNIIHISGTKGKGSTCSFVASFLLCHGQTSGYPRRIGLYTSPHVKTIRERIRINGEPISEELFTKRFFEVWDKLPSCATSSLDIPRYLQLLTLTSYHVFITESVDVAIYETHCGGTFDATNIAKSPTITAVTSIGMDHVRLLGPTVESIARHKAGIFKPGSLAFSSIQQPAVVTVLQTRAAEVDVPLKFVEVDPALPQNVPSLEPKVQRQNCSLALAIVRAWLWTKASKTKSIMTSDDIIRGVENFFWPGRFQKITERNFQWFLDGAHNELSVQHAVRWYAEATLKNRSQIPTTRVLIFSHFSERDGTALLLCIAKYLQDSAVRIQHVILTSDDIRRDGTFRIDRNLRNRFVQEDQDNYAKTWKNHDPEAEISSTRTIEEALDRTRNLADPNSDIQVLITGSLHLVSGALCLLEPED